MLVERTRRVAVVEDSDGQAVVLLVVVELGWQVKWKALLDLLRWLEENQGILWNCCRRNIGFHAAVHVSARVGRDDLDVGHFYFDDEIVLF